MARSRASHVQAGYVLEVAAGTSHHGLAPKERSLSPMQCPFIGCGPTTASAARRARVASLRAAAPPEREREQLRACVRATQKAGCVLEVAASMSHHGLAPKERGLSPVQCSFIGYGPMSSRAAQRTCATQATYCASS